MCKCSFVQVVVGLMVLQLVLHCTGHIGGRTIKWLCDIQLTEEESDNYYHFNDNRVLPPHVDAELATKEGECCCGWSVQQQEQCQPMDNNNNSCMYNEQCLTTYFNITFELWLQVCSYA